MKISNFDHFVLTVNNIQDSLDFYNGILGMEKITFNKGDIKGYAVKFGHSKINFHEVGNEFEPKAKVPTPGSADFCLVTSTPINDVVKEIRSKGCDIIQGPVEKSGAYGKIISVYLRDPDDNLVEISNY